MTASALSRDVNNVFKCGISVAPVTSWIYYGEIQYFIVCWIYIVMHVGFAIYFLCARYC